jgi:hypothetical protein
VEEKHVPSRPGGEFPREGLGREFPTDEHGKKGGESIDRPLETPREKGKDVETDI